MSENTIFGARFFIYDEIFQALFNFDEEKYGSIGIPFVAGDSFCIDIIEQPFHCKVVTDDDCMKMEIYIRNEMGIFEGFPDVTYTVFKDDREPEVDGRGGIEGDPEQLSRVFLKAACVLRRLLKEEGLMSEFNGMDPDAEGILITHENGELNYKKVEGKKRPAMACTTMFGDVQMMRPYMNEISDAWALDMMSFDERVEQAEGGDIDSMKSLANSYLDGDSDVDEDPQKAAYWMEKAAEAGDSESQFYMGLFYAKGHGVKCDFARMVEWMGKASENGEENAEGFLKEFGKMADDLKKAENGDVQAQAEVAAGLMKLGLNIDQVGSERDYEESVKWATKAAEQNNGLGLWTLALAYEHGRGIAINPKKAIELYQKGADINDPRCLHNLACHYLSGENVKKDTHKGFAMIKQAAEQGYGLAMRDLGKCYQFATGTPGNMKTAMEWYEKALEVIDDPELAKKTARLRILAAADPGFDEDYPEQDDGYQEYFDEGDGYQEYFDEEDGYQEYFDEDDHVVPSAKELKKGEKICLENDGELSKIKVCFGWKMTNPDCSLDVSAFLLGKNGKVPGDAWVVFYGQLNSPDQSTVLSLSDDKDKGIISIDFTKLDSGVERIVFVLSIYEAQDKQLDFSMIKDLQIRILEEDDRELMSFMVEDYSDIMSVMAGEVYRQNGKWKFNAIGNGVLKDFSGVCELYGVEVEH